MKTIIENNGLANSIIGKEKYDSNKKYKMSQFCYLREIDNKYLAYNSLFSRLYILNDIEYETLKNTNTASQEVLDELVAEHLLVPIDFDDYMLCNQIKSTARLLSKNSGINSYTILTTTECNARCFYCYEHGIRKVDMTLSVAEDVVQYILKNHTKEVLDLKWFGGEPLYNYKVIDYICNRLLEENIKFTSQITSNGYLFNETMVAKATSLWNVKNVQITLDGTEEIYNRYKAFIYKDSKSPFKIVTNNIKLLLDAGIDVKIRLNMDEGNAKDLYELIDFIAEKYHKTKLPLVYVAMIFNKDAIKTIEDRKKWIEDYLKISKRINQFNLIKYSLSDARVPISACMADNPEAVVISPEGKLCRCEHYSDDEVFGDIYTDEINEEIYNSWNEFLPQIPECKNCLFLPSCLILKKCPSLLACTEDERIARKMKLDFAIEQTYDKWKFDNTGK